MSERGSGTQIVRFEGCELDLHSGELWKDGERLVLPDQPLRILTVLLRHAGALVTRDKLRYELWPDDTFVDFEHSLNAAIKRLREALHDSAAAPRFIETIPRRGYRFVAIVEMNGNPSPSETPEPAPRPQNSSHRVPTRWILWTAAIPLLILIAGRGAHWPFGAMSSSGASAKPGLVRLTSTSGLNIDPALSADGSLLAYASDRGGASGFDIWVQPVGGGDPLQISTNSGDETEPSFSADGSQIVFSGTESGAIYSVGSLGGQPRMVARAPAARRPRFSPDGQFIAYWTGFVSPVVPQGLPGATGSVFVIPSSGGAPRQLAPHFASARYPIWSPDGKHILFLGEETANPESYDWYFGGIGGGTPIRTGAVAALRAAGLITGTPIPGAWRDRDDAVVFATNEVDNSNICRLAISRSNGHVIGTPQRLTFGTGMERSPNVGGFGQIAFESVSENVGVWRAALDPASGIAAGPFSRVTDGVADAKLRNVSRDGKLLAFLSARSRRDEIWIRDIETGHERQVTHAGADDGSLTPDGSRIAFSTTHEGKHQIEITDLTGALPSQLCDHCSVPFGWSPDGRQLLLNKELPTRMVIHDVLAGQDAELLRDSKWGWFQAKFSPDGAWVAFHTANAPNLRQVYVTPASIRKPLGSEAWVPVVTDHGCHPSWSSDGSMVYHFSFRDGHFCPWVQKVDPTTKSPIGGPRPVRHLHNPRLRAASGAAATNDVKAGYLYMTATETTGNIWLLHDRSGS